MTLTSFLHTPRMSLRPFSTADFETFYTECVLDPAVMGFYHAYRAPLTDTERRAQARRDFLDHFARGYQEHGFLCWRLDAGSGLTSSPRGTFLGWCGILSPALDMDEWGPELAYMLARPAQGLGLATEAGHAVLTDAWHRYSLPRLHAVVDAPNVPSRRVLERLAFQLHGPVEVYGSADMLLYSLAGPIVSNRGHAEQNVRGHG